MPIPGIFTSKSFVAIITQQASIAVQQAKTGNWVLGDMANLNKIDTGSSLNEQLRDIYINQYTQAWEKAIGSIHLLKPIDLTQTDEIIVNLMSINSPLLQLLQILHDNTYFVPIATTSLKLQNLGLLLEKTPQSENKLYEIFAGLQALHHYLQIVLTSWNKDKAAFEIISNRLLNHGAPDAITQLRLIAENNPEPIQHWLNKIADDAWRFLMKESGRYLDTSWQNQVIRVYQTDIANRFPFTTSSHPEVSIHHFINFFGNPGIVLNFYNQYLTPLIDTKEASWRWKKIDNQKLAFSDLTLRQIQQAIQIHQAFFPHNDNKLSVQFSLKPYEISKNIQHIAFKINGMHFTDDLDKIKNSHSITWPTDLSQKMTSIQLTLNNQQNIHRLFPGNWGWFKLINQSFEHMIDKHTLVVNFSPNEHAAKYMLVMQNPQHPFTSLNLSHFHFSQQLTEG